MAGLFITFEGPEGCGKSTHVKRLAERLQADGHEVVTTREPGGTPTGEAIRGILQHDSAGEPICPEAETLLFEASRAQLVQHVIRPALERGAIVMCDRFADSTTAYQGYGRGFDVEHILQLHAFAIGETAPGLTLLLDVDVEEGFRRLHARNMQQRTGLDRMERESLEFHRRVYAGYHALAERWPERFRIIDGRGDVTTVHEAIWAAVKQAIDER
jgi:dTMP kinase